MFYNWEKFIIAYNQASQATRDFIDSELLPLYLGKALGALGVTDEIVREITLFCTNKILSLNNDADLLAFIAQNGLDAQKITSAINAALSLFVTESDYDRLSHQTITHEVRKNLFAAATPTQKYLAFSNEGKLALANILSTFAVIDIDSRKKVIILVTDIIFGFYKIGDTVPLLQQEISVDARTAALLGADVLGFLTPLSDPNFVAPREITDEETTEPTLAINPEATIQLSPVSSYAVSQSQPQVTASPYQLAPTPVLAPELHTMATDANAARTSYQPVSEIVYSSAQPALRQPLSDLPSYTIGAVQPQNSTPVPPIEPPRWGV